jgi:hypothetical protein
MIFLGRIGAEGVRQRWLDGLVVVAVQVEEQYPAPVPAPRPGRVPGLDRQRRLPDPGRLATADTATGPPRSAGSSSPASTAMSSSRLGVPRIASTALTSRVARPAPRP